MTKTLLLDLDNTLLTIDQELYIRAFIQAYTAFAGNKIKSDHLAEQLLAAIQRMLENRRPDRTLYEAFVQELASSTGSDPDYLKRLISNFYRDIYPELAAFSEANPSVIRFVQEVLERGDRITIATNPIYPHSGIEQRLRWAGLEDDLPRFEIVASYDAFHFSKPKPAFFAEMLSKIGWPTGEIIVVGDDPGNDILPAREMGLPAYQVSSGLPQQIVPEPTRYGCGDLGDFYRWVETLSAEQLAPEFDQPSAILSILLATPATFDSDLRFMDHSFFLYRPGEEDWSFTEVICHLRDVEREVQLPRLNQVISKSNPLLTGEDTDAWAEQRHYRLQDPRTAFQDFLAARLESSAILEALGPDGWDLPARHTIFGQTNLRELASIAAEHDRIHVNQVWKVKNNFARRQMK